MQQVSGRKDGRKIRVRMAVAAALAIAAGAIVCYWQAGVAGAANDSGQVLATIGGHPITQRQVDDRVLANVGASKLYDLRKQALDSIVDEYVINRAASKAGLTPDEYLKREMNSGGKLTDAEVRQFYDQHKAMIDRQTGGKPFDQIKEPLSAALQRRDLELRRNALVAKLRADDRVKILLQAPRVKVASAGHPTEGPEAAPITIVEFGDSQCPFCRAAEGSVRQVLQQYGDKVKLVYMDFPLSFHSHAMDAARAGRCAADQGKFWQFHDALFADQRKLSPADLKATATKLGLDGKRFDACFDGDKHDAAIKADIAQGQSLGVSGTPTFFINGRELEGALPPAQFSQIINEELARSNGSSAQHEARTN
jgi:protein-disulfide isomerase